MTLKFVIILQNLIKAYHRKSGKSKYDRKLTELDVETTRIRSRVNEILVLSAVYEVGFALHLACVKTAIFQASDISSQKI